MYVSSCTLTRCFISDPSNPSMSIICGSSGSIGNLGQRTELDELDGEFREYAGGRIRLITRPVTRRNVNIVLRALTPQQARQIKRWRGTLLLLRDTYGMRLYGSYLSTQELNIPRTSQGTLKDIAIAFTAVTYSDTV